MCDYCNRFSIYPKHRTQLVVNGEAGKGIRMDLLKSPLVDVENGKAIYKEQKDESATVYIRALCQVNGEDYQTAMKINYCPFCGEKLA